MSAQSYLQRKLSLYLKHFFPQDEKNRRERVWRNDVSFIGCPIERHGHGVTTLIFIHGKEMSTRERLH